VNWISIINILSLEEGEGYRLGEEDEVFAETSEDGIFEGLARLGRSAIVSVSTVVVV